MLLTLSLKLNHQTFISTKPEKKSKLVQSLIDKLPAAQLDKKVSRQYHGWNRSSVTFPRVARLMIIY